MSAMNRIPSKPNNSAPAERVSLAGCVLAASPHHQDPLSAKSVCLIVEHTDEATVGVMLNRRMLVDPKPMLSFLLDGAEAETPVEPHFNFGGPVQGPILAIHNDSSLAEGGNDHGVYLSAQVETLKKLALMTPEHLRWYIGHATWGHSQLEKEIVAGDWLVIPAIPQIVFSEEGNMWSNAIEWYARSILVTFPGVTHFPVSPMVN
jgi:putative transcriptional regulator